MGLWRTDCDSIRAGWSEVATRHEQRRCRRSRLRPSHTFPVGRLSTSGAAEASIRAFWRERIAAFFTSSSRSHLGPGLAQPLVLSVLHAGFAVADPPLRPAAVEGLADTVRAPLVALALTTTHDARGPGAL